MSLVTHTIITRLCSSLQLYVVLAFYSDLVLLFDSACVLSSNLFPARSRHCSQQKSSDEPPVQYMTTKLAIRW